MSKLFVRTLREDPADAEVPSHRLLVRAGYIRRAAPGIYTWLPLGLRVLRKIEGIIREEMDGIGAQEVTLPALLPAILFALFGSIFHADDLPFGVTESQLKGAPKYQREGSWNWDDPAAGSSISDYYSGSIV